MIYWCLQTLRQLEVIKSIEIAILFRFKPCCLWLLGPLCSKWFFAFFWSSISSFSLGLCALFEFAFRSSYINKLSCFSTTRVWDSNVIFFATHKVLFGYYCHRVKFIKKVCSESCRTLWSPHYIYTKEEWRLSSFLFLYYLQEPCSYIMIHGGFLFLF